MTDNDDDSNILMAGLDESAPVDAKGWLATLAGLLARCEYYRSEMAGRRLCGDAAHLLGRGETMLLEVEALAKETEFPSHLELEQVDAVAKAGVFISTAHGIEAGPARGLLGSVVATLRGSARRDIGPAVRAALELAADALESYFRLFGERLPAPAPAGWVDAAGAFVADFRLLVKDLQE